ncbi:unnamed protein product [Closterium sp. Yama58-4]|nr:unnamed protein product [Closterium sp. Yama58-4]
MMIISANEVAESPVCTSAVPANVSTSPAADIALLPIADAANHADERKRPPLQLRLAVSGGEGGAGLGTDGAAETKAAARAENEGKLSPRGTRRGGRSASGDLSGGAFCANGGAESPPEAVTGPLTYHGEGRGSDARNPWVARRGVGARAGEEDRGEERGAIAPLPRSGRKGRRRSGESAGGSRDALQGAELFRRATTIADEQAGEGAAEPVSEDSQEQAGEGAAEPVSEDSQEQAGEGAAEPVSEDSQEQAGEGAAEPVSEDSQERGEGSVGLSGYEEASCLDEVERSGDVSGECGEVCEGERGERGEGEREGREGREEREAEGGGEGDGETAEEPRFYREGREASGGVEAVGECVECYGDGNSGLENSQQHSQGEQGFIVRRRQRGRSGAGRDGGEVGGVGWKLSGIDTSRIDTAGIDTAGIDMAGIDTAVVTAAASGECTEACFPSSAPLAPSRRLSSGRSSGFSSWKSVIRRHSHNEALASIPSDGPKDVWEAAEKEQLGGWRSRSRGARKRSIMEAAGRSSSGLSDDSLSGRELSLRELSGAGLSGRDLSGRDLSGRDLSGAGSKSWHETGSGGSEERAGGGEGMDGVVLNGGEQGQAESSHSAAVGGMHSRRHTVDGMGSPLDRVRVSRIRRGVFGLARSSSSDDTAAQTGSGQVHVRSRSSRSLSSTGGEALLSTVVSGEKSESRGRGHARSGSRLRAWGFRSWGSGSGHKKERLSEDVEAPSKAPRSVPVGTRNDGSGESRESSQIDSSSSGKDGGGQKGTSSGVQGGCSSGSSDCFAEEALLSDNPENRRKASGETSGGGVLWNPYSAEGRLEEMPRFVTECKSSGLEYEEEGEEGEEGEGEGGHLGVAWSCPVLLPDATLGVPPAMHSQMEGQDEGCKSLRDGYMGQQGRPQGKEHGMHEVAEDVRGESAVGARRGGSREEDKGCHPSCCSGAVSTACAEGNAGAAGVGCLIVQMDLLRYGIVCRV